MGSVSPEEFVRFNLQINKQIASSSRRSSSMTFLSHSQVDATVHAFWNVNLLFGCAMCNTPTLAFHAWRADHLACSVTISANILNRERSLSHRGETSSAAPSTFRWCGARLCFCSLAGSASVCSIESNSLGRAIQCVHKIDFQI